MRQREYLEMEVLGRTCYMTQEDLRIFYGLAGHTKGITKLYKDISDDAFIVQVIWTKKLTRELNRERIISSCKARGNGGGGKHLTLGTGLGAGTDRPLTRRQRQPLPKE